MGRVEGKVAFITGAGRGQGRSHAVRLAEEGADIIAIDALEPIPAAAYPGATEEDLAETVRLVEATGRRIYATKADVRSLTDLHKALDTGVEKFGRLDIVCANAGILTTFGHAYTFAEEDWMDVIDVNLHGVWRTIKVAVPHIQASGRGGSIILTASSVGLRVSRNTAHYVASKWGVIGLMRAMAIELGPESIRVNALAPTQVNTPMIHNETLYQLYMPEMDVPTPEEFIARSLPLQVLPIPWVEPVDVSNAVVYLASDEARYVTGTTMSVDGGRAII